MNESIYALTGVFATGMLGIWKAVPVGFALGINPWFIFLLTAGGATTSAVVLYFFGENIRKLFIKKNHKSKKENRAQRLFNKYGTAGLGFLGCLLMGPNMTLIVGLILVKSPRVLFLWTMAGIIIWTLVLTLMAKAGVYLFVNL